MNNTISKIKVFTVITLIIFLASCTLINLLNFIVVEKEHEIIILTTTAVLVLLFISFIILLKSVKNTEQHLGNFLKNSWDEIIILDKDYCGVLYANYGALNNLGYTLDEIKKLSHYEINILCSLENKHKCWEQNKKLVSKAERYITFETLYKKKNGIIYPVEVRSESIVYENKEAIISVARDISHFKQIKDLEQKLGRIMDNTWFEVYMLDPHTMRFIYINKGAQLNTGYDIDEIKSYKIAHICHLLTHQEIETIITEKSQVIELRTELRKKDKSVYPVDIKFQHIQDGEKTIIIAIAIDISDRLKIEELQQNSIKTIEEQVKQKTIELDKTNKMLLSAMEKAQESSRIKSEFLTNMSHEIRTPINGIIGFLQLLSETKLDIEQKELLDESKKCTDYLMTIVSDILDFSKMETEAIHLENISFNLRTTVEETVNSLSPLAAKKNIDMNVLIYSDVPLKVMGDPGRLVQLLNNLVGNAIKFTREGEINILVKTLEEDKECSTVQFEVSDTGIGIPEEYRESIFDQFTQADSSITRKHGGTGLGLAISKKIVEMMEGEISVESNSGVGSIFRFKIKFLKDKNGAKKAKVASSKKNNTSILVLNDNSTGIKFAIYYLKELNYNITEVNSAEDALTFFKEGKNTDAVLLDYFMPKVEGVVFVSVMKANAKLKNIPLILLSSSSIKEKFQITEKRGFIGYLSKPVSKAELQECISLATNPEITDRLEKNEKILDTKQVMREINFNSKYRILVVDDSESNQKLLAKTFNKAGFMTDIALNGEDAIKAFKSNSYDLILMDCLMPVMDGYEAAREIRKLETEGHIPIIGISASSQDNSINKALEAGMDSFLEKPNDTDKVIEHVTKFIPASEKKKIPLAGKNKYIANIIDELVKKLDFSEEEAQDLIYDYINSVESALNELSQSIDSSDFISVVKQAHTLKGASANLRLNELTRILSELENAGKSFDINLCSKLTNEIENFVSFVRS